MNKRFFILSVYLLIGLSLFSQAPIEYGFQTRIRSKILNEERTVLVGLPENYSKSSKKYPVIYLGDPDMEILNGAVKVLSSQGIIPEFIYVSVPHINRDFDLTPTKNAECEECGGAPLYLKFIEEELIPYIDGTLRTQPYRVMAGSSYGGLFTLYCLVNKPELFDGYIASTPSCWFDDGFILKKLKTFLSEDKNLKKYLYVTMGNETGVQIDDLVKILGETAPPSLQWKYVNYSEETHGTVPYKSFYDGLKFIFKDWNQLGVKMNLVKIQDMLFLNMTGTTDGIIYYTTNGTNPDFGSAIYDKPLEITKKTFVKTRLLSNYNQLSPADSDYFDVLNYEKPVRMKNNLQTGLAYSFYTGTWDKLPDFSKMLPVQSGITTKIDLSNSKSEDNFALSFKGFFKASSDGFYTFFLSSDDGSKLIFNNKLLIDNDLNHDIILKRGRVLLKAGYYPIEINYYEAGGGEFLDLQVEGPGIEKSVLKSYMIFHL